MADMGLPPRTEAQHTHAALIFPAPEACVLSSAPLGWKGIQVDEYHFSAMDVPEMELSVHVLDMQLSPELDVEWYLGGRYRSLRMVPGDICLMPSGPHTG